MSMSWPLAKGEISHFRDEGYVVVASALTADDLSTIDAAIGEVIDAALGSEDHTGQVEFEPHPMRGKQTVRRICDPYERHAAFRGIAEDPRMLDRVQSLIGSSFSLQHSKLNMKLAGVGSPVEWHQDLAYYPHTNDSVLTVLVYLDDADEENGCLQVMAPAHDRYLNHMAPDGTFVGKLTEAADADATCRTLAAPAGSAIFMHGLVPHSSLPNRSRRDRRTLIFAYRAADAFPLYYGRATALDEDGCRPMRGTGVLHARFGGPPPIVPRIDLSRTLYDIQRTRPAGNTQGARA